MTRHDPQGLADVIRQFDEDDGYLDFASLGPPGRAVLDERRELSEVVGRARFGAIDPLYAATDRFESAVADATGFSRGNVVFQPSTSSGMMHTMFGLTGQVAVSRGEYPSTTTAAARASESLAAMTPLWFDPAHGRVTPGALRDILTPDCRAVVVSVVDYRTGYLADLEGIRQIVGDRLLIVDAVQGFGVVDAPWTVADIVVSGGQKWLRAGWGTGFMALSDRAAETLVPVFSGFDAAHASALEPDAVADAPPPPRRGAGAFMTGMPDPLAAAALATSLELTARVGVAAINSAVAERVSQLIDAADEVGLEVVSPRATTERAGIVVLAPPEHRLTALTAALFNHGVTATARGGTVRLSAHASTSAVTLDLVRDALGDYAATPE
ncbi:aminotransferase class V-fold PLP-dependent enzyme [Marisediminicola sp. LYQ134]|uniref:aminotransferase class V-fold PLP-dependent enzyme n=1 Tax=Marisediminicola sp. LYQ134 TaxID=3391061 RepID=UPI003983805F